MRRTVDRRQKRPVLRLTAKEPPLGTQLCKGTKDVGFRAQFRRFPFIRHGVPQAIRYWPILPNRYYKIRYTQLSSGKTKGLPWSGNPLLCSYFNWLRGSDLN